MKQCGKCRRQLPLSEFHGCKANKDGLQKRCKDCERVRNRERAQRMLAADPEKRRERLASLAKWSRDHPEAGRKHRREWARRSYAANPLKWRQAADKFMEKARAELRDTYVKQLIAKRVGCSRKDVPDALVAAKKTHIAVKRLLAEKIK